VTIAKAQEFAKVNNAEDEDGWTYTVEILNEKGDGYAKVVIREPDGYLVGEMI